MMKAEDMFNIFPREFGLGRWIVTNKEELKALVEKYNGLKDVYVSLYACGIIDKVFFDVDSRSLQRSFSDVKELLKRLEENNIPFFTLFSGRKGFHVYIPLKPWRPPNPETAKAVLKDFQLKIAEGIRSVDRAVIGDLRRLVRYPNTLNKSCYCTPLPFEFVKWSLSDVIDYAKQPHDLDYDVKPIDVRQLVDDFDNIVQKCEHVSQPLFNSWDLPTSFKLASKLLRPCVVEALAVDRDPPHLLRFELVAELSYLGWSEDQILKLIEELKWVDYNPHRTRYHVRHIISRKYLPLSCRRLRYVVRCRKCGWVYFWGRCLNEV